LLNQSVWIFPIVLASIDLAGILWFGPPADRQPDQEWQWDRGATLIVSYVSRGDHQETLRRAASRTQAVLDSLGVRYIIESVTDVEVAPQYRLKPTCGQLLYYVVPPEYVTTKGTRFKARALQFLLEHRTARLGGQEDRENIWVLHMDEESFVTPESALGIHDFVERYDLRRTPGAIGQGEILYNSCRYGQAPLIEAIDAMRSGADLGRFRMQYRIWHAPLFGTHGSFILTPARLEREITWDVGGYGVITEDAYFGLIAMERGVRFDWVDGFIREQSPFSLRDLIQQRRRWFCGLMRITRDPRLQFRTTLMLRLCLVFWALSVFGCTASLFFLGQRLLGAGTGTVPYWLVLFIALCGGLFSSLYVVGAYRNVLHAQVSARRKLFNVVFTFIAWVMLIPWVAESVAVFFALVRPVTRFHIVEKDLSA
jgi:egghead protein (zeste-white 4 protein)